MPELAEYRIMSDFINQTSKDKIFFKAFNVERGNIASEIDVGFNNFIVSSKSIGKELILDLNGMKIYVFMGMSGNWSYLPTSNWNSKKFVRLRLDDVYGGSLLLHGGFMGPRYSINKKFNGTKRGPDPTINFDLFKENILKNIDNKVFDSLICESLLNQEYFNGIGNYLRSTILYYSDSNPFENARVSIMSSNILDLCKDIPLMSYKLNGGQLKDWKNPFNLDSNSFDDWVFYQKGLSCKDKTGRTFWFDTKWKKYCPYIIKNDNTIQRVNKKV